MNRQQCLITGLYRSGTTLLDKLLHAHPQAVVASQPFSGLYAGVKQAFLDNLALQRSYPLDHLMLERDYRREDFYALLDQAQWTAEQRDAWLADSPTEGQMFWRRVGVRLSERLRPGTFRELVDQLYTVVQSVFGGTPRIVGTKEIVCEEYAPYLLAQGMRVLMVLRDPRDVICSTNLGAGRRFAGEIRPTLFTLRNWRKSVAMMLACRQASNFFWCRYEDLVMQPTETLRRVVEFLELDPFPPSVVTGPLRDQEGGLWAGNSSFFDETRVHDESVGRFRDRLTPETVQFIETCCLPEMRWLGYELEGDGVFSEESLQQFREPFPVSHRRFDPDYSIDDQHLEQEIARYRWLVEPAAGQLEESEIRAWFLDAAAYESLRAAAADSPRLHAGGKWT